MHRSKTPDLSKHSVPSSQKHGLLNSADARPLDMCHMSQGACDGRGKELKLGKNSDADVHRCFRAMPSLHGHHQLPQTLLTTQGPCMSCTHIDADKGDGVVDSRRTRGSVHIVVSKEADAGVHGCARRVADRQHARPRRLYRIRDIPDRDCVWGGMWNEG